MLIKSASFRISIVVSAFLLFLIQPIIAKQILPWFGGSASVWNTCLFFFQFLLLLGYTYANALIRFASAKQQAMIHVGLLCLSLASLPVIASPEWKVGDADPALNILLLLSTTVGLPYFLLSTTSPLIQAWYSRVMSAPYRLFALSNAASLVGLLAYPFLLEPTLTTSQQAKLWSGGFVLFALACAMVAFLSTRIAGRNSREAGSSPGASNMTAPTVAQRGLWITLSALGSLTLISVTSFVAQNIASMPLIWVVPLAIYLITFILAFGRGSYRGWPIAGPALGLSLVMAASYQSDDFVSKFYVSLPIFMAGLFFVCLYCHGELAATKPDPNFLTGFYVFVSLGGALGSLGGSLLAPVLLSGDFEMPLTLVAVAAVFAWQHRHDAGKSRVPAMAFAIVIGMTSAAQIFYEINRARLLTRNFYGSLRIVETGTAPMVVRRMEHGAIEHGSQYLDPERRKEPISYYSPTSGVALALRRQRQLSRGQPLAIGVVGLGAGALAAYGQPGDQFRFYEINPQVIALARSEFTYLSDSKADVSTHLGDARLVLEREPPQAFDMLVVDAFSGDAIPIHLLTREALAIYRKHLKPFGVVLFHISNKFVDLKPALSRLAVEERLEARIVSDEPEGADDDDSPLSSSDWVMMYADQRWLRSSELDSRAEALDAPQPGPAWTDDFNTILSAVRLGGTGE